MAETNKRDELVKKMLNLHTRLKDVKKMKKSAMIDYKDQIKEIESEIEDVITELEV